MSFFYFIIIVVVVFWKKKKVVNIDLLFIWINGFPRNIFSYQVSITYWKSPDNIEGCPDYKLLLRVLSIVRQVIEMDANSAL